MAKTPRRHETKRVSPLDPQKKRHTFKEEELVAAGILLASGELSMAAIARVLHLGESGLSRALNRRRTAAVAGEPEPEHEPSHEQRSDRAIADEGEGHAGDGDGERRRNRCSGSGWGEPVEDSVSREPVDGEPVGIIAVEGEATRETVSPVQDSWDFHSYDPVQESVSCTPPRSYTRCTTVAENYIETPQFPDQRLLCWDILQVGSCSDPACNDLHTEDESKLLRFLGYTQRATTSLDVCIYTVTSPEIADAILDASERGVNVRVIADYGEAFDPSSWIPCMEHHGLNVHFPPRVNHAKFCIVDQRFLLSGSFNYSGRGITCNNDIVDIHDGGRIVQTYSGIFAGLYSRPRRFRRRRGNGRRLR